MNQTLRIILEGAAQAWQQLISNKLRSFLSLLGVTIGIFCIIGVKSAVNSLEDNIRNSMEKLGNDVIYIEKFSWSEDPSTNYWKWMRRPNFSYTEFEALQSKLKLADKIGYWQFLGAKTVKFHSSSVENVFFLGITEDCQDLFHLEFENDGRFFSAIEYQAGRPIDDPGFHLFPAMGGQAVEKSGVLAGKFHKLLSHRVRLEDLKSPLRIRVAHRHESIGNDDIRPGNRLFGS